MRIKYADPLHEGRCRAHSQGEGWPHHFLRRGVGVLDWEIAWTPNVALWSSNTGSPHRVVQSSASKVATNTSLSKHVAPNNPKVPPVSRNHYMHPTVQVTTGSGKGAGRPATLQDSGCFNGLLGYSKMMNAVMQSACLHDSNPSSTVG